MLFRSMLTYISALRILVKTCEYKDLQDEMVRDRVVCGIRSDTVRKQMLKESTLTLARAVELCKVHEVSDRHTKEISDNGQKDVHAFSKSSSTHHRKSSGRGKAKPPINCCRN